MKIINAGSIKTTAAHGDVPRKALIKAGDSKTKLQTVNDAHLDSGQGFEPHVHEDCEEVYYFIEGEGIMTINGREIPVGEGICILVEAGESHGLKNTDKKVLRFITMRLLI